MVAVDLFSKLDASDIGPGFIPLVSSTMHIAFPLSSSAASALQIPGSFLTLWVYRLEPTVTQCHIPRRFVLADILLYGTALAISIVILIMGQKLRAIKTQPRGDVVLNMMLAWQKKADPFFYFCLSSF